MNEILIQFLTYVFILIVAFVSFVIMFNSATNGYLLNYIRVRRSKGKKILVLAQTKTDKYYGVGYFDHNALVFVNREKVKKIYTNINADCIFDIVGVKCVEINEINDSILDRNKNQIAGSDVLSTDSFINRILMAPRKDNNLNLIQLILIVVIGLLCLYIAYQVYQDHNILTTLYSKASVIK